jgi:uncharacterized membrane protein YdfJ with MMPL/SSD domain
MAAWVGYGLYELYRSGSVSSVIVWLLVGIAVFVFGAVLLLSIARYVPGFRKPFEWWLNWLAEKTQKTKTREEVEKGFWGKLVNRVMKRPAMFAIPIIIVMVVLVIPLGQLAWAVSARSTCRRTTRCAWHRRSSTGPSPASAPSP